MPVHKQAHLRAIVNELVHKDVSWKEELVGKMLRDLKKMRHAGVYPTDIVERNYKGGLLVNMSIALTKPNFYFEVKPAWQIKNMQSEGLLKFDKMMERSGFVTWKRAYRNEGYCSKLRSSRS